MLRTLGPTQVDDTIRLNANEAPNDDPFEANDLLIRYQASRNFGQTGYLTGQVVALVILDYLSPISQNGNN